MCIYLYSVYLTKRETEREIVSKESKARTKRVKIKATKGKRRNNRTP